MAHDPRSSVTPDDLGLRDGELRLVSHRSAWAESYKREAARLRPFLPPSAQLEHISSTAVPGLIAKPVLDLAVRFEDVSGVVVAEVTLPGLNYRFRDDAGANGGRIWLRDLNEKRTHILHLVAQGDSQRERWLALRDLLRQSALAREQYAEAKAQAMLHARDRQDYTRLKTATIHRLLAGW